ncbi:hypothetical protein BS78_K148100 [Paspalum vaginatum]|uniref:Aminotransferase-like plant mobile domain-containing protein n=1 Tax=Paspalum vaginatum TaxID=158149 RepID=A0A9W7XCM8_9POAL|nr:hypothetical protein BS78_K148100 [Paspalum vaginatum]
MEALCKRCKIYRKDVFTRQGQNVGQIWASRLAEFVAKWSTALDDLVMEGRPHDDAAWGHYLRWYLPRTRLRVLSTPQELPRRTPSVTDNYPTQRDQGAYIAVSFFPDCRFRIRRHLNVTTYSRNALTMASQDHKAAYDKIAELCRRVTRSLSCRGDNVGHPPPQPMFVPPNPTPPQPPPYGTHVGSSSRHPTYHHDVFAAGTSRTRDVEWGYEAGTTPDDSYGAGHAPDSPPGAAEQMAQSLFASPPRHDEIGYSQLQEAPPHETQQSQEPPAPDAVPGRRTRQAPDPFSHGSRHTWAARELHAGARGVVARS